MEAATSTLEGTMDIGRLWYEIKINMERAAEVWKMVDRERLNKGWLDEECKKELEKRNKSRKKMIRDETEEARNDYPIQRKITKKTVKRKKEKML